jgi:hypothetical protein
VQEPKILIQRRGSGEVSLLTQIVSPVLIYFAFVDPPSSIVGEILEVSNPLSGESSLNSQSYGDRKDTLNVAFLSMSADCKALLTFAFALLTIGSGDHFSNFAVSSPRGDI